MDPRALRSPKPVGREKGQIREGLRYLKARPDILLVMTAVFFAGTFGFNFQITSALMATHVFHKGAGEFGLLGSTLAIGSLTGALIAARRRTVTLRLVVLAAIGFGTAIVLGGLMPTYVAFAIWSPIIGIFSNTMMTSANANVQLTTEPQFRGRVMALYMMVFQGGTPIGAPLIGWIGQEFGARWTLILGGLLTLTGAFVAVAVFGRRVRVGEPERVALAGVAQSRSTT